MLKSLWLSLGFFYGICLFYIGYNYFVNDGEFTYLIDDGYIHLAIAKNFAQQSVWGVTAHEWVSSSSSPLFTILVSFLIYVFGNHVVIPLVLNLMLSGLIVCQLWRYARLYTLNSSLVWFFILFVVGYSLLYVQVVLGMEHTLHILITSSFVLFLQRALDSNFKNHNAVYGLFFCLIPMGLVRFESIFLFAGLAFLFVLLRYYKYAVITVVCGFVPVVLFGWFNYSIDGFFFPNSILVKGTSIDWLGNYGSQLYYFTVDKILLNPTFYKLGVISIVTLLVVILYELKSRNWRTVLYDNFVLIHTTIIFFGQLLFGEMRTHFRYEAYLMVMYCMGLARLYFMYLKKKDCSIRYFLIVSLGLHVILFTYKVFVSQRMMLSGVTNVHDQQVQMAKFLKMYYNSDRVVANDIGAVSYFTDIHLLDVIGLGSTEIMPYNHKYSFGKDFEMFVGDYTRKHDYKIALVYKNWFDGHLPKNWIEVGGFCIKNNKNVAGDCVSFFAIDPKYEVQLKRNIRNFKWNNKVSVHLYE